MQKKILRSNFICYVRCIYDKIFSKTLKGFGYDIYKGLVEYGYALATYLEDSYKLQCRGKLHDFVPFNIINIPPRFGKTEICAVYNSWYIGRNSEAHILGSSYSESLTAEACRKTKQIMKDCIYQAIFPDVKITKDCDTANHFKTTHLGEYYATGITGTITGRGAGNITKNTQRPSGYIFIDDPLKAGEATGTAKDSANEAFQSTFLSRRNHPYVPYLIIMQRLNTEDLCGFLETKYPSMKKRKLILPALIKNLPLSRENASEEFLEDLKNANPEVFWGQYMQNPTLEGDLVFDVSKINIIYNEPPKDLIFHSFTVADTSMVNKPSADFTVFGHFYVYAVSNWRDYWNPITKTFNQKHKIVKLLLREIFVTRIDAMNLRQSFEAFLDHRLENSVVPPSIVYIETKSSGIALYQEMLLLQERGGKYERSGFRLQELGKENLPKEMRFSNIAHFVKESRFEIFNERSFQNHFSTNQYIFDHLSKITRLKNSSIKDDIADVITYGLASTYIGVRDSKNNYLGQLQHDVINKLTSRIMQENRFIYQ